MSEHFSQLVQDKMRIQQQNLFAAGESVSLYRGMKGVVDRQLESESAYYDSLWGEKPLEPAQLETYDKKSLAPRINETGMSRKRRDKVVKRTRHNLEEGTQLVGKYATSQTTSLMRSIRKNSDGVRENVGKMMDATRMLDSLKDMTEQAREVKLLEEQEQKTITELSNLVIPADIFDLEITKEHSHFDVKKALTIKEKLQTIADYKEKHPVDYKLLDFDVYVRLETLLDHKEMFDTTLKTVLEANGVTMEGEKAKEDDIREARKRYYPTREAYNETVANFSETLDRKRIELYEKARDEQKIHGEYLHEKKEIRKKIVEKWESFREIDSEHWMPLTKEFLESGEFDRCVYRMVPNDEEECYRMIKMDMYTYLLGKSGADKEPGYDERLSEYKKLIVPYYLGYREKAASVVKSIEGKSIGELTERYKELLTFEKPWQHLVDMMKINDFGGEMLKDSLGLTVEEKKMFYRDMEYISRVVKVLDVTLSFKALKAGVPIHKRDLSANLEHTLIGGDYERTDGAVLDIAKYSEIWSMKLSEDIGKVRFLAGGVISAYEKEKKQSEERRAKILSDEEMSQKTSSEQVMELTEFDSWKESNPVGDAFIKQFSKKKKNVRDLTHLKELAFARGLKLRGEAAADTVEKKTAAFGRTIRELFGGSEREDLSEGSKVSINEKDVTLKQLEHLLENFNTETCKQFFSRLTDFDLEKFMERFDDATMSDIDKKFVAAAKGLDEIHYLTTLSQWADALDMDDVLGEELLEKISIGGDLYVTAAMYLSEMLVAGGMTKSQFEMEKTYMHTLIECIKNRKKIKMSREKALADFETAHPVERYTYDELKETKVDSFDHFFFGKARTDNEGKIMIPVSREELSKIVHPDGEFIENLAEKVSQFSFITDTGRMRIMCDDPARDLLDYGESDFRYYAEVNRYAKMLIMANESDHAGVQAILGDRTDATLTMCKRIQQIFLSISSKLYAPGVKLGDMRNDFNNRGGESLDQVKRLREDAVMAHAEKLKSGYGAPIM